MKKRNPGTDVSLVDELRVCQSKQHCGYRLCRRYRDYWLCLRWCWRSRKRLHTRLRDLEKRSEEK